MTFFARMSAAKSVIPGRFRGDPTAVVIGAAQLSLYLCGALAVYSLLSLRCLGVKARSPVFATSIAATLQGRIEDDKGDY